MIGVLQSEVDLTGINARLDGMAGLAIDATGAFEAFGLEFRAAMASQFESEGSGLGRGPWAPLKNPPREPGRKILQDTYRLMLSLTTLTRPGNVTRIKPQVAEFGTSVFYGRFHQTGTRRMPARPIIVGTEPGQPLAAAAVRLLAAHLMGRPMSEAHAATPGPSKLWTRASVRPQP